MRTRLDSHPRAAYHHVTRLTTRWLDDDASVHFDNAVCHGLFALEAA